MIPHATAFRSELLETGTVKEMTRGKQLLSGDGDENGN